MSNGKMLILRGNSGSYEDEDGKKHDYNMGALHEKAAKDYAAMKGYDGEVLPVAGDSPKQADDAVQLFKAKDSPYAAIYGFSGGGYHVRHILEKLPAEALTRIKLVVVLGAPPTKPVKDERSGKTHWPNCKADVYGNLLKSEEDPKSCGPFPSDFESTNFASKYPGTKGIKWDLVYWTNPDPRGHMFGPDWLLAQELKSQKTTP
jgi:pimeloyl-ACP methyl ester carboxylesterase